MKSKFKNGVYKRGTITMAYIDTTAPHPDKYNYVRVVDDNEFFYYNSKGNLIQNLEEANAFADGIINAVIGELKKQYKNVSIFSDSTKPNTEIVSSFDDCKFDKIYRIFKT